jgi:aminoglycoside 2'-N-acetyltransferase I
VVEIQVLHTADLGAGERAALRALLDASFEEFTDDDWDHALGGLHAIARDGGEVLGHAAVVQRQLLHGERILRTGYVEGVAVRADRRRQGHGDALMAAVERVIRAAYHLGALAASDEGAALYGSRGWLRWSGPIARLTPAGPVPTPDDDGLVHVLPGAVPLDPDLPLLCDPRPGDPW